MGKRTTSPTVPMIFAAVLLVGGIPLAPMVVPILPVETLASVTGAGGGVGVKQERREEGQLPQHFADRFGWENMAATVAGVYDSLPAEDRSRACVFTANYGEAGAITASLTAFLQPRVMIQDPPQQPRQVIALIRRV